MMPFSRRLTPIAALAFGLLPLAAPAQDAPAQNPPEIARDDQLLVMITPPAQGLITTAEGLGYTLETVYPLGQLGDQLVVLTIPEGRDIPTAIDEIEAAVPGTTAGAHHLYRLQSSQGADFAGKMIGWPSAGCVASQPVGLLDTGLAGAIPGLSPDQIKTQDFTTAPTSETSSHGTDMAAIMMGDGRLTGAKLFAADVVNRDHSVGEAAGVVAILRAVDWLAQEGVELVNISLAGPRNKLLNRGLGQAAKDGMVMVAAAGNLGPSAPPQFPAAFPFVLSVTAVDAGQNVYPQAVQGAHIDLAAPGVDILFDAETGPRVASGTSAAAPFVTAAIAADPSLVGKDIGAVREVLAARARDLGTPGHDPVFGAGLLQAPTPCK